MGFLRKHQANAHCTCWLISGQSAPHLAPVLKGALNCLDNAPFLLRKTQLTGILQFISTAVWCNTRHSQI